MKIQVTLEDILNKGVWDTFCDDRGLNEWMIKEGLANSDDVVTLTEDEAKKYGFIK